MSSSPLKYWIVMYYMAFDPKMVQISRESFDVASQDARATIKIQLDRGRGEREYVIVSKKIFSHGENSYIVAVVEKRK